MDKEQRFPRKVSRMRARRGYSRRRFKLADKTRELNARKKTPTDATSSKTPEGLLEARRAQELAEARKEAEKLREESRKRHAITEQAEEEAMGIVARASAFAWRRYCGIPPNQQDEMINWAEEQAPEDRQATEDVLDNDVRG